MIFWKKQAKAALYRGDVTIVPRSGIKTLITEVSEGSLGGHDEVLRSTLQDLLTVPPICAREPALPSDLALDIIVPEYQFGAFMPAVFGKVFLPVHWRPKITMTGRVYEIDTRRTIYTTTVKHALQWRVWSKGMASPIRRLGLTEATSPKDVEHMTVHATTKLLTRISKNL